MSARVGLDLTSEQIRAVTVSAWRGTPLESFAMKWDPRAPAEAVEVLRKNLGDVSTIAISVGVEFLHVKHVKLPPIASDERRNILLLEPDRFFPVEEGEIVVSVSEESDLVFAADASLVESWIAAAERWAPVNCVEAAPQSLARALANNGVRDGSFALPAAAGEYGIVELEGGVLTSARRIAGAPPASIAHPPEKSAVEEQYLTAFGAALGLNDDPDAMLLSNSAHARIKLRRRSALLRWSLNCTLALLFFVTSVDRYRSHVQGAVNDEIAAVTPKAATAAGLQGRLAQMDLESSAARDVGAHRADPVMILAELSRRLPRDATVMSARADGDQWQIDGTAADAGALIPALAQDPRFDDVRFLSASSRFREGNRAYETFSIAFHARPAP